MLIAALLALSIATTPSPAAQVEAAERAFAADGLALGVRDSFLKHMADDAIVFRPGPTRAKALYETRPSSKTPKLQWWPQRVVAARSGDLALSMGPWAIDGKRGGYYATIWRKDPDGRWRWIYDGGAAADPSTAPGQETPAGLAPAAPRGEVSAAAAFDAVRTAEALLAKAAEDDASKAYGEALATDAWLLGPDGTQGLTPTARAQRLEARPERMILTLRAGGASRGGDLVWTHGEAGWADHQEIIEHAHYMHVWQRRPEGWRLIFETLINDR
jgi:ketosteroid isomerase-like protein